MHLAAFRRAHTGIVVELVIDNRVLSLSRREADIALRPIRPKESDLWGRRLGGWLDTLCRADLSRRQRRTAQSANEIARYGLIGGSEATSGIEAADWLAKAAPPEAFVYRTNSLVNHSSPPSPASGSPSCLVIWATARTALRALINPIPELEGELWIVTHVDLRRTARVRAFFDIIGAGLAHESGLFEGMMS